MCVPSLTELLFTVVIALPFLYLSVSVSTNPHNQSNEHDVYV